MIVILFPPGCYGSYIARCLYAYTSLSSTDNFVFEFDSTGSSHAYRYITGARDIVRTEHARSDVQENDTVISIVPNSEHKLDYFDNQFCKQSKQNLGQYIDEIVGKDAFLSSIQNNWLPDASTIDYVPVWVTREFFSFFLEECLPNVYKSIAEPTDLATITTDDIFYSILPTIQNLSVLLELDLHAPTDIILDNHARFLAAQTHHTVQMKCNQWVEDCLNGRNTVTPCSTIFDEAYVQLLLRKRGIEIRCDGLNIFPSTSIELRKIIN